MPDAFATSLLEPLLKARGLWKSFPGVRALEAVDFTLRRGEIHALMGENGAGKSTLIKILTGVDAPDAGEMALDGKAIQPRSPQEAQRLGISTVYQEINLIPQLSVAENITLGREPMFFGKIRWREVRRRAREALARLDVDIDVSRPLAGCSIALQQLVAVARALDVEATRVLILDEPTSSLAPAEVERLFGVMRRLRGQGLGIIFITHFLEQVYAVSDRVTVLRNGKLVGEHETSRLSRLQLVSEMMGREVEGAQDARGAGGPAFQRSGPAARSAAATTGESASARPALLEARGLKRRGAVEHVDLEVRAREIVGLAGLVGSGRTETARLLFGIDRPDRGEIRIEGRRVRVRSPRGAMRLGMGFAPEDRKTEAILPDLSVRENIVVSLQASRGWWRRLSRRAQGRIADGYIRALNIRTPDADRPIRNLSGGNQQKAILARWLALRPRLLILDEPTRGIDVGAKAEVERLASALCGEGMAIVFISSELDELARNCHRVVVLRDRRAAGELEGEQISAEAIMRVIATAP